MKRLRVSTATSVFVFSFTSTVLAQGNSGNLLQQAVKGTLKPATIYVTSGSTILTKTAPFFSSGVLAAARAAADAARQGAGVDFEPVNDLPRRDLALSSTTVGCSERDRGRNTRVNQDCTFQFQAEESIVFNPANRNNLLAGMNDGRAGADQCGIAFSTDNGQRWGDMAPPFRERLNNPAAEAVPTRADPNRHTILGGPGTLHTYDGASDPSVAFDSHGRGYFSCIAFDSGFNPALNASLVFVTQSPPGAQGSFFFNIPAFEPQSASILPDGRRFIVVEDNSPEVFHDKEFIAADTFTGSPNRDNVYVTWTVLRFSPTCGPQRFCSSPIFGSMSTNHGVTWSTPEEISGASPICVLGNLFDKTRPANACDFDQAPEPIVLPNGNVVVVFNNMIPNNPNNQQLAVVCQPTGSSPDGTAHMNCAPPVKVGDDVTLGEPNCDFGRGPEECIPGAKIRTNDFPRIAVNKVNGHLYATWQDYRNGEFDIQMARSLDGGATWGPTRTVNPDRGLDHYFAAIDIAERADRDRVGVSYFRTQRPFPGNSDYVLGGGTNLNVPYRFKVVSPVFRPPDGIQAGFNGDYTGLTINHDEEAHPIWSDTRNVDPYAPANVVQHDEDIFTDKVSLPDGVGSPGMGQIGKSNSGDQGKSNSGDQEDQN